MAAVSLSASAVEALVLGLATGPVCLASCGPVVLPWMLVQPQGMRPHSRQLFRFLAARLAGYLVFAAAVWLVGSSIPHAWSGRSWLFGGIQLLLAAALVVYAAGWPLRRCALPQPSNRPSSHLVQIGEAPHPRPSGALALGFLTGINLCPPFLVAGVRAAQLPHLSAALLFFLFFFAGTAVWFIPFLSLGFVRRTPAVVTVARMVAVLLACWYGYSGISTLIERAIYG
ncbi:MAG: sulfite exporter TauE/SafE family protein [Terracidiphilus sp.]